MNSLKTTKQMLLLVFILAGMTFSGSVRAQPGVSVPIESFYAELAPYGQWMQYPGYGDVWLPNAGPNFQPYATAGHWVMTDYGNTWVSDYPWGWAPFHYGRWIYDSAYGGWLWIPGSDWAPAWVDWRVGNGYYGWAPLGPNWGGQVNVIPAPFWTFVPQVYITSPTIYSYYVPRPNVINIYQRTTIINNVYQSNNWAYNYGPPRRDIERVTRQSVPVYRVDRMDRPGRSVVGNGSVGFYHPGGGNGQNYGRADRYDNPNRSGYSGSFPANRSGNYGNGNNVPNRSYPDNNRSGREYGNAPTPNIDGNRNNAGRGGYSNNVPANPNGGFNTSPTPSNPQPDRTAGSRGSYSSGSNQQSGFNQGAVPQPSSRPFERVERAGTITPQAAPNNQGGGQGNWTMHRPEGRGGLGTTQQAPAQNQPSGNGSPSSERGMGGRSPR